MTSLQTSLRQSLYIFFLIRPFSYIGNINFDCMLTIIILVSMKFTFLNINNVLISPHSV